MKFIKNRYLLFGIILLALLSTLVSFNLFFRETANERQIAAIEDRLSQSEERLVLRIREIEERLDKFEARFKPIEERLDILDAALVRREILNPYGHNASSIFEEKRRPR